MTPWTGKGVPRWFEGGPVARLPTESQQEPSVPWPTPGVNPALSTHFDVAGEFRLSADGCTWESVPHPHQTKGGVVKTEAHDAKQESPGPSKAPTKSKSGGKTSTAKAKPAKAAAPRVAREFLNVVGRESPDGIHRRIRYHPPRSTELHRGSGDGCFQGSEGDEP